MAANSLPRTLRRIPGIGLPVEILKARFGETFDAFFEAVDKNPQVTETSEALKIAAEQTVKETAGLEDILVNLRVNQLNLAVEDLTGLTDILKTLKTFLPADGEPPPSPPPLRPGNDRNLPPPPARPKPDGLSPGRQGLELLRPEPSIDFARLTEGLNGANQAMARLRVISRDTMEEIDRVGTAAFGQLEQILVGFAETGKFAWQDLARVALDAIGDIFAAQMKAAGAGSSAGGGFGAIGAILSDIFGGLFGGPREHGGPVAPGRAFLVGEAGPELFVPPAVGEIVPAHALGLSVGGAAPTINITQNFDFNISPDVPEAVRAYFAAAMPIPLDHSARFAVG